MSVVINIQLSQLEMPSCETVKRPTLEERLQYAVECLESGHNPKKAYELIKRVTRILGERVKSRKPTEREINLIRIMKPILEQYSLLGELSMPAEFWSYMEEINNAKD